MTETNKRKLDEKPRERVFSTGGVRDENETKGRFDLLPQAALWRLAKHFQQGAKRYEARNWEKGIPISAYVDSAMRHLTKFVLFLHPKEDHLIACAWNILCAYETWLRIQNGVLPKELNDMPFPYPREDEFVDGAETMTPEF